MWSTGKPTSIKMILARAVKGDPTRGVLRFERDPHFTASIAEGTHDGFVERLMNNGQGRFSAAKNGGSASAVFVSRRQRPGAVDNIV